MNTRFSAHLIIVAILLVAPCSMVMAESSLDVQSTNPDNSKTQGTSQGSNKDSVDRPLIKDKNWYFSWGYSRQYYAPSDIHVTQPGQGNNFTVHQAQASDLAANVPDTIDSTLKLNFFAPQENIRLGKFMDAEKTFAIEFSLDHSKYNTNIGQTAYVTGTVNNQPYNQNLELNKQNFDYVHHNGLNHIMANVVWLNHLYGPKQKPGDLESISRIGAGFLLPHSENTIFGNENQVGPKWGVASSCCFARNDWWQLLGWTAGVEVGLRYRIAESVYLELTAKEAYGVLRRVPVYQGSADQEIWMTEGVFSVGYLF
jgi:hypothetical protein